MLSDGEFDGVFDEEVFADGTYRKTGDGYTTSGSDAVRQRFAGYQRDLESGLDFAEARYYDNTHGRFTAVDPLLASGKSADPQTFNRYVYVMNQPLTMSDSSGMQAGKDDGTLHCQSNCNSSYDKATNTVSGRSGALVAIAVQSLAAVNESIAAYSSGIQQTISLGCAAGGACLSSAGPSELDMSHNQPLKTVEAFDQVASAMQFIPIAGQGASIVRLAIAAGRGDVGGVGESALMSVVPMAKDLQAIGKGALFTERAAEDSYTVYQGFDKATGVVKYVGMTMRDPEVRFAEHMASGTEKALLRFGEIDGAKGLTKIEGRTLEQQLINKHGLNNLLNKINSVAPKYWEQLGIK